MLCSQRAHSAMMHDPCHLFPLLYPTAQTSLALKKACQLTMHSNQLFEVETIVQVVIDEDRNKYCWLTDTFTGEPDTVYGYFTLSLVSFVVFEASVISKAYCCHQHHLDEVSLNLRTLLVSNVAPHHHPSENFQPLCPRLSQDPRLLLVFQGRLPPRTHLPIWSYLQTEL